MTFAEKIAVLRARYYFSVTSWWRTEKRNRAVGGAANSQHLNGLAVDVVLDDPKDQENFVADCAGLGLNVIVEGDHLHVMEPRT